MNKIQPLWKKIAGPCLTFVGMIFLLLSRPDGITTGNIVSYIALGLMVAVIVFVAIVTSLHIKEKKNQQLTKE